MPDQSANPTLSSEQAATTESAVCTLVRLLARQAAREAMAAGMLDDPLCDGLSIDEPESET